MISVLSEDSLPRLMIADEDPEIQALLDVSLSREFDVVGLAVDGEEAVRLAKVSQPDAALVDIAMLEGGGLRAVRRIHEVAPDTAIVVLSIDESGGAVRELMQAGAVVYLRKGVEPELLAEALMDSIHSRRRAA